MVCTYVILFIYLKSTTMKCIYFYKKYPGLYLIKVLYMHLMCYMLHKSKWKCYYYYYYYILYIYIYVRQNTTYNLIAYNIKHKLYLYM